jgi:rubrerythrin
MRRIDNLLRSEPAGVVTSLDELFAIAHALESEAAARYAGLAQRMRKRGDDEVADLFDRLAEQEREHIGEVDGLSRRHAGKLPDQSRIRWELPATFDEESLANGAAHHVTSYQALSVAVRNEERAFSFWSYVAARAAQSTVRAAAESMAREELEHVSLLRRQRRKAYHAERGPLPRAPRRPRSSAEALAEAAALERRLADQLDELGTRLTEEPSKTRALELAQRSRRISAQLRQGATAGAAVQARELDRARTPAATAELLVECYLEAAERAPNDSTIAQAQSLAGEAISRLAWLRSVGDDRED